MRLPRIVAGALGLSLPAALLTTMLISNAPALDAPVVGRIGETVKLGPEAIEPRMPLTPELAAALTGKDHARALTALRAIKVQELKGDQVQVRAFLEAWTAIRAGKAKEAVHLVEEVRKAEAVPADYRALTVAELLLADDKPVEAAQALSTIPGESGVWSRSQLLLANAYNKSGATADALRTWEALVTRADPSPGTAQALLALARKAGIGSEPAYTHLRRLWAWYPGTAEAAEAGRLLASTYEPKGAKYRPRDLEIAIRAERMMDSDDYKAVTDWLGGMEGRFVTPDEASCQAWYAYGRSHFKRNNVTKAAEVLVPAGKRCAAIDKDRGARALYIAGKALERKKEWSSAAQAFEAIPALYPEHSMADDGYALAGVAYQVGAQPDKAIPLWERQVQEYPDGDLAAEGFWRLAWNAYLAGDTDEAIDWAERMTWEVPIQSDPVHVLAGRYWAARWRIHPDRAAPARLHPDPERVRLGTEQLLDLCRQHPTSFYALLAAARLHELAPDQVAAIPRPQPSGDPSTLTVRADFLDEPEVQNGLGLARLGLVSDALNELDSLDEDLLLPSEMALIASIVEKKNPIVAHDRLHHYLLHHPASTLGVDRDRVLRQAYPDHYWTEVQQAAQGYGYDPRIFHALVREESSFNRDIVSWAGAKGLSQLMPATARTVASWMGTSVNDRTVFDPLTNLRIGSRYLEYLRGHFNGNMFLAVPAYNAGEGNVGKWLRETANPPTDEFIESIPIRETRHYVKRVLGTYQLYNTVYGTGPLYPDWSAGNHKAKP